MPWKEKEEIKSKKIISYRACLHFPKRNLGEGKVQTFFHQNVEEMIELFQKRLGREVEKMNQQAILTGQQGEDEG